MIPYNAYLTPRGLVVREAALKAFFGPKLDAFLQKLTIEYKPKKGPPQIVKLYAYLWTRYSADGMRPVRYVRLPRGVIPLLLSRVVGSLRVKLPPIEHTMYDLKVDLFDNQKLLVDACCALLSQDRIEAGLGTCILNLRAGMGKTFVAAGVIERLGLKTLYVVPRVPLAVQAEKDLYACFGKEVVQENVKIVVINSLLNNIDNDLLSSYHFMILDEVHMYCSAERRKIFTRPKWAVMGMSATTEDRKDGYDVIATKELGICGECDPVLRAENIPGFTYDDVVFDCKVRILQYSGPPEHTQALTHPSTGSIFFSYMIAQMMRDPARMTLAVREIMALYNWRGPNDEKHCIYVFCEECGPLKTLHGTLVENGAECLAPEVGEFMGGIKSDQITTLKDSARILLSTYGYAGTGVSIEKMTAIVFLTPRRANMKQILARVLRRGGDLTIPRCIVDIVDSKTPIKHQLGDRLLAYRFYGMAVEWEKHSYVDYTDHVVTTQ